MNDNKSDDLHTLILCLTHPVYILLIPSQIYYAMQPMWLIHEESDI